MISNKSNAAVIQVAAPADLNVSASAGIVATAGDGDIIELTTPVVSILGQQELTHKLQR